MKEIRAETDGQARLGSIPAPDKRDDCDHGGVEPEFVGQADLLDERVDGAGGTELPVETARPGFRPCCWADEKGNQETVNSCPRGDRVPAGH